MAAVSKITIFLFYLSIIQFTHSFAVMTGDKLKLSKHTRAVTNPTFLGVSEVSHHTIRSTTPVFEREEPCGVIDSFNNKRTFNCSSASSLPPSSPKTKHCTSNSRLVGENCLCNEGYRKFPFSEICVKERGQPCMFQQNDCRTDLTNMACVNNMCSCEDSDVYDPITFRCVGRVGGLCFPGIKDCTLNADCVNVPQTPKRVVRRDASSGYYYYRTDNNVPQPDYVLSSGSDIELSGRCECREGFVESQGSLCKKSYGQTCASADECDTLNLVCKEGLCACPDTLQVYDPTSSSCVALVGAKCSDELGGTLCVKFAFCQKANLKMDGKCACNEEATETNIRTCDQGELTSAALPLTAIISNNKNEPSSARILFDI